MKRHYEVRKEKRERLNLFMLKRAKNYIVSFLNVLIEKIEQRRYFKRLHDPLLSLTKYKVKKQCFKIWMILFEKEKYLKRSFRQIQHTQSIRLRSLAF